jgi:hypothetical protein
VHVAARNGKLIGVTAAVRVLPRHWDGGRLLRFLTGLATLALAFTARLDAPSAPVAPAVVSAPAPAVAPVPQPVRAVAPAAAPVAAAEPAPVTSRFPAPAPVPAAAITLGVVLVAGVTLRVRGQRAPPPA